MSHRENIIRIKGVHNALGELKDTIAFVGGATVSLYADKPEDADVRPTDDIDILVEIGTYGAYIKIQEKLLGLGFTIDVESNVTCRYKYQGLTVDVMATEEGALGFSNRWYKEGFANIIDYKIDENTQVHIFSSPYFIASKIEAFKSRGENDGRISQDFEDIIFVLDNRKNIWSEMQDTKQELNTYLQEEWKNLLGNKYLEEWVSAHLECQTAAARAEMIMNSIKKFCNK